MRNTHVDLHSDHCSDALCGIPGGKEDGQNELRDKIEHAALDDDIDGSAAYSCWEFHTTNLARLARREIPDASGNEGRHYHVRAQCKRENGKT